LTTLQEAPNVPHFLDSPPADTDSVATFILSPEISTPSPLFDMMLAASEALRLIFKLFSSCPWTIDVHAMKRLQTDLLDSKGISAVMLHFVYEITFFQALNHTFTGGKPNIINNKTYMINPWTVRILHLLPLDLADE
jgi:hypothetical protein